MSASNDPGLHAFAVPAEDPEDPRKEFPSVDQRKDNASSSEEDTTGRLPAYSASPEDSPLAPDQFLPEYETSRNEIWAYYAYYIGNNGLTLFNYAPTQAQNLLYQAAGKSGMLFFAGANRTIDSIILLSNGISFAIQIVIFLVLGSYADFGTWRPNILIILSIIAYGLGFGWLGVHDPSDWQIGIGLYIVGLIAYQTTLTFWTAAFPGLARNTRELRVKAEEFEAGVIDRDEYDREDTLMRSRLSNMAFYIQSLGEIVILAIIVGILFGVHANRDTASNNYALSIAIAFASGAWLLLSIPWFVLEKRRKGIEPGMNIVLAGFWQLWRAITQVWQLRQSLFYLIGYFLLGDSLNTTVTQISILQASVITYDTTTLTYLLIVGIAAQAAGIYIYWFIQRKFRLDTKTMFNAIAIGIILLDGWGMIGNWTDSFGFHHVGEIWAYQVYYGLFVCPWYSYSQIMISEVTPRGHEYLFFSLFSIVGKTSSFIGPLVSSAIVDAAPDNNSSSPFYFLFSLSVVSFLFLFFFVDLKKSRIEQARFLENERIAKEEMAVKIDNTRARMESVTSIAK